MTFGSPSHRLEAQLNATAKVLEIDAQFVHIPGVVVASFGDQETHTSETHFVKGSGGLVLGSLHHTHDVYRMVVHDEISVENGTAALNRLLKAKPTYPLWLRVVFATVITGVICPMGFGGSVLDAAISAIFGAMFGFLQLRVAATNPLYANIFEISTATIVSFIARGLSSTGLFCYESLSSSGVVMILPGYVILCGSLELASKNIVCGSVRMVYAIIYSLFLGFGIAIGSELEQGNVMCFRDPSWQWYRQNVSAWWLFLMVPVVSLTMSLSNGQPWKSRELPVQVFISCTGFTLNRIANAYIFNHSDVVSFLGAFAIGVMGNFYSRVFKGTALTSMATGVLFLVPSGIAAAGGLAMTNVQGGDSYSNGLVIGFRMVQVAIGITVGLFFSSFVVYSFGSKKRGALFVSLYFCDLMPTLRETIRLSDHSSPFDFGSLIRTSSNEILFCAYSL
ncbi:DUF1212-domain-containing protein [Atractiella rhizophila]|nr:DUF1212-domain-containing protein [Atractiella rhizophila]